MQSFSIEARMVNILRKTIEPVRMVCRDGKIVDISPVSVEDESQLPFLLPGFVDAHVHIESSLLIPAEFARLAVVHGTVATVSDPHEIANVCGIEGVDFMIRDGNRVPFKFNFGAPSCVPATIFETAGAELDVQAVESLLERPEIKYLSEMMNFPGVLFDDAMVMQKIAAAKKANKPVDGHAPGLRGDSLQKYIHAGISTDHECFTYEEGLDKLERGMKVLIREGSAAKNFEALIPLMEDWYELMMFCSDDKHPDSLLEGHINQLCARAVAKGINVFKVLRAACINPVKHYGLDVGLLNIGDPADFILIKDLVEFEVLETYIDGVMVAGSHQSLIEAENIDEKEAINNFNIEPVSEGDFKISYQGEAEIKVIEALDGQLITNELLLPPLVKDGFLEADISGDILKIAVINRYHQAPVAVSFIKNIGMNKGALASSVAHDSHNIVVVGCDDISMARAANLVISKRGGLSATDGIVDHVLGLPVAGLMSVGNGYEIADQYTQLDQFAKTVLGSTLRSPFMTLSFMALLVIPHLKLSDKGLFNGDRFEFV